MTWTTDQAREAATRYRAPPTIADHLRAIAAQRHAKLVARLRKREIAAINHGQATPQIRMIVSDWYRDEFGNRCRTVRAAD